VFILTITVDIHQSKPRICSGATKTPALNLLSTPTLDQSVTEMPCKCSLQTLQTLPIRHPRLQLSFSGPPARRRVRFLTIIFSIPKDLPYIRSILKINKLLAKLGLTLRQQILPRNRWNTKSRSGTSKTASSEQSTRNVNPCVTTGCF
jgi:hypothetical protein